MISQKQLLSLLILTICFNTFSVYKMTALISGQRDAWIGVLISLVPALCWAFLLAWISNRIPSMAIQSWLKERAGTIIGIIITAILAILLTLDLYISMTEIVHWTNIWYLPNTPYFIIVLIIGLSVLLGSLLGLRTVAIATGILLPLVVVLFMLLVIGISKYLHLNELVPLIERGWTPVGGAVISSLASMSDWFILILLLPFVDTRINFKTMYVLLIVHVILLVVPIGISLSAFGNVKSLELRNPVFEQWRLSNFGIHFSHIDFLSIIHFFSISLIRQSLLLFTICSLLSKKVMKPSVGIMVTAWIVITCICMFSIDDVKFVRFTIRWHDLVTGFGFGGVTLVFIILCFRKMKVKPHVE